MRGPVLTLRAGPGMRAIPVALVPALTDDLEPLPRRRRSYQQRLFESNAVYNYVRKRQHVFVACVRLHELL